MRKLSKKNSIKKATAIVPLNDKLPFLKLARTLTISKMSGWPTGLHVIGRLQKYIKLSSYSDMLNSIYRLRDLVRITADVIDMAEGMQVEKAALNRTEIKAWVLNIVRNLGIETLTDDDIDLITQLIISYESNVSAWTLEGGSDDEGSDKSIHLQFKALYDHVIDGAADAELPIYNASNDSISKVGALPQFGKKPAKEAASESSMKDLKSFATLQRFAAVRVIDHVYHLLTDKDIWYEFVAPRIKPSLAANLERGRTLKVLSLYLQHLLSYGQFFALETYIKGYDLVQDWIQHFPPLDSATSYKLEHTIRQHDVLGVKRDVEELLNSFSSSSVSFVTSLTVFPTELLGPFGIAEAINKASKEADKYIVSEDAASMLTKLGNPSYLPLLAGTAMDEFDVTSDLAQTILLGSAVSGEINHAIYSLLPTITRNSSTEVLDDLRNLQISCSLQFRIPHACEYHVEHGTISQVEGGTLALDSGSAPRSYDYHRYLSKDLRLKMVTDLSVANNYEGFTPKQAFDRDKAADLRAILGINAKSLVPSSMQTATAAFTRSELMSGENIVRSLFSELTGMSFELFKRILAVKHSRKDWATVLSSFGLIYYADSINDLLENRSDNAKTPLSSLILQEGWGAPYGTTYANLERLQGALTAETMKTDLIEIGKGIWFRLLNAIPVATQSLARDYKFYHEHHYSYFTSNSGTMKVAAWVKDDSLLNFACFPVAIKPRVPNVLTTRRFGYLNQNLFLNFEEYYMGGTADEAREKIKVSVVTENWPFDKFSLFLEYTKLGSYFAKKSAIVSVEEESVINEAVTVIEQAIKNDNAEARAQSNNAGQAEAQAEATATEEIQSNVSVGGDNDANGGSVPM